MNIILNFFGGYINMLILETIKLTKKFGGLAAVDKVDLKIHQGEIRGLIGPNGSGKTTFFNMINGILFATEGIVKFKGENITGLMPHLVTKKGIGRTLQQSELFQNMTVLENIEIGIQCRFRPQLFATILHKKSNQKEEALIKDKAFKILEFVGLESLENELAKNLPYGLQRMVEIARALATSPELILLDEPVAGMNLQEASDAMKLITKIRNSGITILLVEHQMQSLMNISDFVTVLNHGKKIVEGTPKEIQNNKEVIEAYLGKGM